MKQNHYANFSQLLRNRRWPFYDLTPTYSWCGKPSADINACRGLAGDCQASLKTADVIYYVTASAAQRGRASIRHQAITFAPASVCQSIMHEQRRPTYGEVTLLACQTIN